MGGVFPRLVRVWSAVLFDVVVVLLMSGWFVLEQLRSKKGVWGMIRVGRVLLGVRLDGVLCCDSMFDRVPAAGPVILLGLV